MSSSIKEIGDGSHIFHANMGKTFRQQHKRSAGVYASLDDCYVLNIAEFQDANCDDFQFGVESYYISAKDWSVHAYARKTRGVGRH